MELIRGIHNIRARHKGSVLSIGNFDGVHLGHQALLNQLKQQSQSVGLPVTVVIFEPQPLEFFFIKNAPARLMSFRDKCRLLAKAGIDRLLCIKFDQKFASMSAKYFISELLVKQLGVRYIITGDDFRFGSDRRGNRDLLINMGRIFGFSSISAESILNKNGQRISSTAIRKALQENNLQLAEMLLGRPYHISGRVIHGKKLGRMIGFPTANIPIKQLVLPIKGVYAVEISGYDGRLLKGIANIGTRPTVSGIDTQLEINIFDFEADLYGKHLNVVFRTRLRDEKRFASLNALKEQINLDAVVARHFFELAV